MNKVILSGNLTRDVELKFTASGKGLARMSIAVQRPFAKDKADFFNLVAWEKQAENYRSGKITKEKYDDWRYNYKA